MAEAASHPNVTLYTLSEVKEVNGRAGDFKVKILKHPRYVDETKCTGCGACYEVCPVEVPNEFDMGLGVRKAIYVPFPQAVPLTRAIDKEHCVNCRMCIGRCKPKAIDYDMQPQLVEVNVGSIIVTTGYDEFKPDIRKELGYGIYQNVITTLEFERLAHATGPTEGHIVRPSDGKTPQRVIFVQCVGARDLKINKAFCNKACCMYGMKNAGIVKMHYPDAEVYVSYIDIRAAGKLFEEFYQARKDQWGIKFVKGRASKIVEDPNTKNLIVSLVDMQTGDIRKLEADLVVLVAAFEPAKGTEEIAKILGLKIAEDGFFEEKHAVVAPNETAISGIYLGGVSQGPKDTPDSICHARGAASASTLNLGIPPQVKEVEVKPEFELSEEPKIGVFVCHCGGNISNYANVQELREYAEKLPSVAVTKDYVFMCSEPGQKLIKETIAEKKLNRITVAACTPRVHELTFRKCLIGAGLDPYYFELVNIRDQDSLVHMNQPKEATEKAKDLIRSGVARVIKLESVPSREIKVQPTALIIGAGVSGIHSALDLANRGFKVYLIEREAEIGGRMKKLYKTFPTNDETERLLKPLIEEVKNHSNIKLLTSAEVISSSGTIGDFAVIVKQGSKEIELKVGVIILATGTSEYEPAHGEFGYKINPNVITQLELEQQLKEGKFEKPNNVIMIQCVGSRQKEGNKYCSRICCNVALKNAMIIKEKYPEANVYILYRDLRAYGRRMEEYYQKVQEMGVMFIEYDSEKPPEVTEDPSTKELIVKVEDAVIRRTIEIPADKVVLSVGTVPQKGIERVCELFGITRTADGFLEEVHLKLEPNATRAPGVYIAGSAAFPKDIPDSISMGRAAASVASIPLVNGLVKLELVTALVDEKICVGCGICETICPFEAIRIEETPKGKIAVVNEVKCKGCGQCVAACPIGAMSLRYWRDEQILASLEALLAE